VAPGSINLAELERFFRDGLAHFGGNRAAKMGRHHMAVVDGKLKASGVEGLRIADASFCPLCCRPKIFSSTDL
jgi:choline dehydrogenase-like flavoprotein